MPETLFYDETGDVVFRKHGVMTYQEMKTQTQAIVRLSDENE